MTMQADTVRTALGSNRGRASRWAEMLWPALLALAAIGSSWSLACVTPFAAFALVMARTLPLKPALAAVAAIWLANQAVGFLFLSYPLTADCLMWGAALGAGSLGATLAVAGIMRLGWPAPVKLAAELAVAFGVYEGGMFALALVTQSTSAFSLPILRDVLLNNALWAAGLLAAYQAIAYVSMKASVQAA